MVSNRRFADTSPDFYPTPEWGTRALLSRESFIGSITEPCCGDGAMSKVLAETGLPIHSYDLYDRGFGITGVDFQASEIASNNIITNPPFSIAEYVLDKALSLSRHKVCLLLRTAFLESKRRYVKFYQTRPPIRIHVFSERLSIYPKGYDVEGGGTTSYAWFVWDCSVSMPYETTVHWIEPGWKPKIKRKI